MEIGVPLKISDECLLLKTRRAARTVTRRYDAKLKPHGLKSTQVSLLFAIAAGGFGSIGGLADVLVLERSALTRNLHLLRDKGLIQPDRPGQGRTQRYELTAEGEKMVNVCIPLWVEAQREMRQAISDENWDRTQRVLTVLGNV